MTARVLAGVGLVAGALYLMGLGAAPFLDPPEGIHAQIAWEMLRGGGWVTPHLNTVPYFDKPPLLYWLMAAAFWLLGPTELAARVWSALSAVGVAVLTAWIGLLWGGARVGLLAGLMVAANLEVFLFGRMVKPDLLFVCLILLGWTGFILAYLERRRWGLGLFYGGLGLAVLAKDFLGAVGPLAALALFLLLTREADWRRWVPWGGLALLLLVSVPWYALVEAQNRGFLWYTVVDNHLLNVARQRLYPDEDVPLGALEFLAVTAVGFFPWVLALPAALWRAGRGPWRSAFRRVELLLALWVGGLLLAFTLSPFRLPHYGLPAFPFMALLAARWWTEGVEEGGGGPRPAALLGPPLACLAALAALAFLAWRGTLTLPREVMAVADVAARNLAARGQQAPGTSFESLFGTLTLVFGLGALGVAAGLWWRRPMAGLGALLAAMIAFLPVTVQGVTLFAKSRSVRPMTEGIARRAAAGDLLAHEGAIENSASWLLSVDRPVKIVNGLVSNLAFGATLPGARDAFWDARALAEAWRGDRRVFLLSGVQPSQSVVRELPPETVHLLLEAGGRWLYSNRP